MSQAGYTPIQLYYSATAAATPSAGNLAAGELAVNITDGKLFYKDNGGVVRVLATAAGSAGDVVGPGSSTDNALVRFDGTTGKLVQNSAGVLDDSGNLTGLAAVTMSGALTLNGGVANGVAYLNGSKVLTTGSALTFDGITLGNTGSIVAGGSSPFYGAAGRGNVTSRGTSSAIFALGVNGVEAGYLFGTGSAVTLGAPTGVPITFDINGEQMRLTSTGLGIGTSSPSAKLHAYGNIEFGGTSTPFLYSHRNAVISSAVSLGQIEFAGDTSGSVLNPAASVRAYADGAWTDSSFPANLRFYTVSSGSTSETERMRLDSSGNLGLGVTPSAWGTAWKAFDFNNRGGLACGFDETDLNNNVYRTNTGAYFYKQTAAATTYNQSGGQHIWLTAPSGTAGNAISFTQAMTLHASGGLSVGNTVDGGAKTLNVGITAATTNTLVGRVNFQGYSSAYGAGVASYIPSGAPGIDWQDLRFYTSEGPSAINAERARIDSSGNLLVGTTSYADYGNGFAAVPSPGFGTLINIGHESAASSGRAYIIFGYNGNGIGSITQNGTTAVAYNTSSDYRLKNITGPVTNSGAYIDSLNPVEGTWKADGSTFVGLIAHEVQEASRTQVATGVKDGEQMQGMDYSSAEIIANLIAELQSVRKRLAVLEAA